MGGDGTPTCSTTIRHVEADDPARHLDRPRSIHQADHRRHVRGSRPTDHPADLQPHLEDRGDALRCHPLEHGKALVATGIPLDPVPYNGVDYQIGQANNALLYPGLALGTIVSRAKHVTPNMLVAAADAVAGQVDPTEPGRCCSRRSRTCGPRPPSSPLR